MIVMITIHLHSTTIELPLTWQCN